VEKIQHREPVAGGIIAREQNEVMHVAIQRGTVKDSVFDARMIDFFGSRS
jgi:hypothetical protein